jgi:hypothetical protein
MKYNVKFQAELVSFTLEIAKAHFHHRLFVSPLFIPEFATRSTLDVVVLVGFRPKGVCE